VRTELGARVTFFKGDLLSAVEGPIDLIVANLPYIPTKEVRSLQSEVQREPLPALDGGPDGMVTIRRLIPDAARKLRAGGRIALEIGLGQGPSLVGDLSGQNFREPKILKDYQGRDRYILATHG
jgi:release factor glutamine methyltransferase